MRGRALLSAQKPLLSFPFHPFAFPSGVGSVSHPTLVPPPSTVLFSLQHPGDPTSSSIQHRAFSTHHRGPSPGPGPGPGPHDSRPNVREGQTALRGGVAWSSCRVVLHPIHAKLCLPCNKVFAAVVRLRLAPRTAKRVGCGCAAGPTIRCLDADTSRTMFESNTADWEACSSHDRNLHRDDGTLLNNATPSIAVDSPMYAVEGRVDQYTTASRTNDHGTAALCSYIG
jgi:hypothetical protein